MSRQGSALVRASLGTSSVVATISTSMLVISTFPKLRSNVSVSEFYEELIRKPILRHVFGADFDLPWSSGYSDAVALWLSLFLMINVFVYRNEGVYLWGHIHKNYCMLTSEKWSGVCTALRTLVAFIATPVACLHIALMSLAGRQSLFTSCYITLDPNELASYLKHVGMAVSLMVGVVAFAFHLGMH